MKYVIWCQLVSKTLMDLLWDETVAPNYQKKELSQQRGKSRVHTPCTGKPTRLASSIYTNDIVRGNPAVHGKGTSNLNIPQN
jgi:hypothetical protein